MNSVEQIKAAYRKRSQEGKRRIYSPFERAALFMAQQREQRILDLLAARLGRDDPLRDKQILDAGCGEGVVLRDFVRYGANPECCHGIDLLPERIETARRLSPNMNFTSGNAERLPYGDENFDIVLLFTVVTSILDDTMKQNLANEVTRVLKPGGFLLYYDFHVDNYRNRDVKGVKKSELAGLFPGCELALKRTTLAPPITRKLAPISIMLCQALEKASPLCTHYLGTIRKS